MYASYIEMQLKPGTMADAIEMAKQMEADLGQMGMKQFIIVDRGNDSSTVLALYDTAEDQVAATPKAQEVIGILADLAAAPPERVQVEVAIDHTY